MEDQPDIKFRRILADIRTHLDFLFKRGFSIAAAMFIDRDNRNWQVLMTENDRLITILCAGGKVSLGLGTLQPDHEAEIIDLVTAIRLFDSTMRIFHDRGPDTPGETESLQKLAWVLENSFDDLFPQIEKSMLAPPNNNPAEYRQTKTGNLLWSVARFCWFGYSFTSPSITSPLLEGGGVEGPPGPCG